MTDAATTDPGEDRFRVALRERLEVDRLQTVTPPVGAVLARARRRGRTRAAGAVLAVAAVAGGVSLVGSPSRPAQPAGGLVAEVLLAEGADELGAWRLLGRAAERCLLLVRDTSEGGACGLADPPRLQETSVRAVGSGESAQTLIAGLVPDGAERVVVDPSSGELVPAQVRRGGGLRWFVLRLDGVTGVDALTALAGDGAEVDRLEMPLPPPSAPGTDAPEGVPSAPPPGPPPPPPPAPSSAPGVRAPAALRLTATDEFGRVTAVREGPEGLEVDVDRVDWLSGQEAVDIAAGRGEEPGGDYHLVDDSPRTRTYGLSDEVAVWGSLGFGVEPSMPERVTLDRWRTFLKTAVGRQTLFHLEVEDGVVLGIEEQYRP